VKAKQNNTIDDFAGLLAALLTMFTESRFHFLSVVTKAFYGALLMSWRRSLKKGVLTLFIVTGTDTLKNSLI